MTERKNNDGEVQRVVRHFCDEPTLRDVTQKWSSSDFLYGLSRVTTDAPGPLVEHMQALLSKLRDERDAAEIRALDMQAEEKRHKESLEVSEKSLKMSGTANHIAKWAIVIAIVALIISVIQAFWHP